MRGVPFAVLLAVMFAATSHTPSAAQTPAPAPVAVPTIPAEIGTFKLAETHTYPDPHLGTLYRFRNDTELRPDVYVYPIGRRPESGGPLNPAREEGMNFGHVLTAQKNQRRIDSFEILASERREHDVGSVMISGWHVHAVLEHNDAKRDTHMYVYVVGDQMLKVRSTFGQGSVDAADLERFVADLLREATHDEGS